MKKKRLVTLGLVSLFGIAFLFPVDFTIRFAPQAYFPAETDAGALYKFPAGGIGVSGTFNFFDLFGVGPEVGFYYIPVNQVDDHLTAAYAGLNADVYFLPLPHLLLGVNAGTGVYRVTSNDVLYTSMWFRGNVDVAYRITPEITIAATAGYINFAETSYFDISSALTSGMTAGIALRYNITSKNSDAAIKVDLVQETPVFPSLYSLYKSAEIGTLAVTNNENVEIRDVKISFSAEKYTQNNYLFAERGMIGKMQTVEVPLNADFAQSLLSFGEDGKIPGTIKIEYTLLGKKRTTELPVTVLIYKRNAFMWRDPATLASFVLPTSESVMLFSKFLAGIANNNFKTGLNKNMQTAMYIVEGINAASIACAADPKTPYAKYHADDSLVDYMQYPQQTMQYKAGDCDEVALLAASLFESVGIDAMLIPADDDVVVAYSLGMTKAKASPLFDDVNSLITENDTVWVPLSMKSLHEGYAAALAKGIKIIETQKNAEHIIVSQAWESYPPAEPEGLAARGFKNPSDKKIIHDVSADIAEYISSTFTKKINVVLAQINKTGGNADLYNELGMLYVRSGDFANALAQFTKGAALGSTNAMVNMGNIYIIQQKYTEAEKWFAKALDADPQSPSAASGLKRVKEAQGAK